MRHGRHRRRPVVTIATVAALCAAVLLLVLPAPRPPGLVLRIFDVHRDPSW